MIVPVLKWERLEGVEEMHFVVAVFCFRHLGTPSLVFSQATYSTNLMFITISIAHGCSQGACSLLPPPQAHLAMQETEETQVRSLGGEDRLEEGMATHSSILALRIPRDRGGWQSLDSPYRPWGHRVRHI